MFLESLIILIVIIVGEITFLYTLYGNIFTTNNQISNTIVAHNKNLRLLKLSLSSGGALVPYGNAVPNDDVFDGPTTEVELTDAELDELLQIVFAEIGDSNLISVDLLQSLGLYTDTVVSVLQAIGYIIF